MRIHLRTALTAIAVLALSAVPARAATLGSGVYTVGTCCGEPLVLHGIDYIADPGEVNHVTVASNAYGMYLGVVRDPNIPMRPSYGAAATDPTQLPDGVVQGAAWGCTAPTGKGTGICVATPGNNCWSGGCSNDPLGEGVWSRFNVQLGGGNDSFTSPRGVTLTTELDMGPGDDTVDVRNNVRDHVHCSDGYDTVVADTSDEVFPSCEVVTKGLGLK